MRLLPFPLRAFAFALALGGLLVGCDVAAPIEDAAVPTPAASKLRHGHLLDQASRSAATVQRELTARHGESAAVMALSSTGGSDEGYTGLIVGLDTYKVLSRYGDLGTQKVLSRYTEPDAYKVLSRYDDPDTYKVLSRYEYDEVFDGFAVWVSDAVVGDVIADLSADEDVAWIEPDIVTQVHPLGKRIVSAAGYEDVSWGVERLGDGSDGAATVDLFVVDTGIETDDVTLAGGVDFTGENQPDDDRDGHGTHVAGTAAALANGTGVRGVAPGARVHSLRVLTGEEVDDGLPVDLSKAVAALEHVVGYKLANPNRPVVVNMSLGAEVGTTAYTALDEAVAAATQNGVVVVVAAGNSGIDAATVTPAHAAEAITVGAYDADDRFASFSNYGAAVDILAPGVDILSLKNADRNDLAVLSGTSMAAGFVSGAVAAFLAEQPNATPDQVKRLLVQSGKASISGTPSGTTNRTVFLGESGFFGESGLLDEQLPPFFQYAVFANKDVDLRDDARVRAESGAANANVFANNDLKVDDVTVRVEGFGYYVNNVDEAEAAQAFAPRHNPTGLAAFMQAPPVVLPELDVTSFFWDATHFTFHNYELRGSHEFGTREDPVIWYVDGDLKTVADITVSGYAIILVEGNVDIKHSIQTTDDAGEATLAIYANGNIKVDAVGLDLAAQLYARDDVNIQGGRNVIRGSVTAGHTVKLEHQTELLYRPVSPALTRHIWGN